MCFLEYNAASNSASDMCLRPRPIDSISTVFGPIDTPTQSQNYQNLDDFCGYYIYPYDLARDSSAQFASFFVNDYHFTFTDTAYAANAAQAATGTDYTWMTKSTFVQASIDFQQNPYPNDLASTGQPAP